MTQLEFEGSNNKKYKIKDIWDSAIYIKKQMTTYHDFIIGYIRKTTLKKTISGSPYWQNIIFKISQDFSYRVS